MKDQIKRSLDELAALNAKLEKESDQLHDSSPALANMPKNEDKMQICELLLPALKSTRSLFDLNELNYDEEHEIVTATFDSGFTKQINVAADSGISMIKDILAGII